jgi:hypothetical protein
MSAEAGNVLCHGDDLVLSREGATGAGLMASRRSLMSVGADMRSRS